MGRHCISLTGKPVGLMDGYWELPRPFTSHARSEVREWIDAIAPYYPENFFQMTFRGQPLMGVPENTGDGHGRWHRRLACRRERESAAGRRARRGVQ